MRHRPMLGDRIGRWRGRRGVNPIERVVRRPAGKPEGVEVRPVAVGYFAANERRRGCGLPRREAGIEMGKESGRGGAAAAGLRHAADAAADHCIIGDCFALARNDGSEKERREKENERLHGP